MYEKKNLMYGEVASSQGGGNRWLWGKKSAPGERGTKKVLSVLVERRKSSHPVGKIRRAFTEEMTLELGLEGWLGFPWEWGREGAWQEESSG